jgi:uncharacterized damage-inducible protein DinB
MSSLAIPSAIQPVALIFKLNNEMVVRSLDGLSDEECWRRPAGAGNPLAWLLGHATVSRAQLLGQLGQKYNPGLGPLFDRGSTLGARETYPAREAMETAWKETRGRMRDAFGALSDAALAAPPSGKSFPGVSSIADLIAFYAFHECYHVGQMGYVRRLLGRDGVAG